MAQTPVSGSGAALTGRRVVLGVSGGIAAYKSPDLVRRLRERGAEVQVVMTAGARAFITPLTLQAVSGQPVRTDLLDPAAEAAMGHIELARWADLLLVAPASANLMARLAHGMADDLLTTLALATAAPVALAPAMNQQMWAHAATRANCTTLASRGVHLWGPDAGAQACGDVGAGRMSEPLELAERATGLLGSAGALSGRRVLITAGPTREAIDPVRYISNHSSGKQGYALAAAAAAAGAEVVLVSGPVALAPPPGVQRVAVESAREMAAAVQDALPGTDIFIGVAAVADYRPTNCADQKIKKGRDAGAGLTLQLTENPDIIRAVAAAEPRPFTVGFAAETEHLVAHARDKLERKQLDLVVANDVSDHSIGFGADQNTVTLVDRQGEETLGPLPKTTLATALMARVAERWQQAHAAL